MQRKRIILLMTVLLLLLFGCSFIDIGSGSESEKNKKIEMPNVIGLTFSDAFKQLSADGFENIVANREQVSLEKGSEWLVSAQSEEPGTQVSPKKKIVLSCIQETKVYFEIESDDNFIFSTYDVVVSLDNTVIMTIPNGEIRTSYQEIMEGEHTLSVRSAENQDIVTSITINIEGETYYRCEIKHTKDSVKIKGVKQTTETIVRYLKVIDVQGMPLDKAQAAFKEAGFINVEAIDTKKNESITWFEEDYLVTSQSIAANKEVDKNNHIVLKCVSIDDYLSENFDGATILDAEKTLARDKYSYSFIEAEDKLVDISGMSDEEKELWVIQKIDWTTSKGASFTVKKLKIAALFDLHCFAKVAQSKRDHVNEHYLINTSNHLIVEWTSSAQYTWGYYIGDLHGLFYLVTGVSCGKCDSKGSSSSFTHYGEELFGQKVTFDVGKPWGCEDRYADIVAAKPSDMSNYTEIHAHIDGRLLLIKGSDYSSVIAAGKKLGWKIESDGTKQSTGELECVMNTGNDGLIVTIRYSPSTKEISYIWIQETEKSEKKASLDRKKEIALAIATAICPPEDVDAVKAWVSRNLSATQLSRTIIHGVPYMLGHNFLGNFVIAAGFDEK